MINYGTILIMTGARVDRRRRDELIGYVRDAFVERVKVISTVTLDAIYLIVVGVINLLVSHLVQPFHADGVDGFVVRALQWMLGLSTIGITLAFLIRDVGSAFARALRRDHDEDR